MYNFLLHFDNFYQSSFTKFYIPDYDLFVWGKVLSKISQKMSWKIWAVCIVEYNTIRNFAFFKFLKNKKKDIKLNKFETLFFEFKKFFNLIMLQFVTYEIVNQG